MKHTSHTKNWIKQSTLLLITLALVACGSGKDDTQMVLAAKDYIAQNQIREAALELKNALQANPKNAEARYLLGQIQLDIGDVPAAEKEFRRAAEAGWNAEQAQLALGQTLLLQQKFDKLDEIEADQSWSTTARANLLGLRATAEAGKGNIDQARSTVAEGEKIQADALQVVKIKARLQLFEKEVSAAQDTLDSAQKTYPNNTELMLLSANAAIRTNDTYRAKQLYQQAIELDPPQLITRNGRTARIGVVKLHILENNYPEAHKLLDPLLKRNANDPEANYLAGLLAFKEQDNEAAEIHLRKIIKLAPDHAPTLLLMGAVSYSKGEYEQAVHHLARYVSIQPNNLEARKLLGRTYMMLEQPDRARDTLQTGLGDNIEDAELLALIGLVDIQGGDALAGIEGLKKAAEVAPDSAALKGELAKAYISAGQTDNAIQLLNTLLAEGGEQQQVEALLITAHLRAGQFDKAIDVVMGMLEKQPEDPAVLTMAGSVFASNGNSLEARGYFNQALQASPGFIPATIALARLEELEGNDDKAEALYQGVVDAESDNIEPLIALARLAERKGNTQAMLERLEEARERAPNNAKPRSLLGEYYLRNGQPETAENYVSEAVKIAPQDNVVLALNARVLIAQGQYNKALTELNELVGRVPDSAYARTLLGEVYLKLGQPADAGVHLQKALEKQPNSVPALALIAMVELQLGEHEQALDHAKQIQKIGPDLHIGYQLAGDALSRANNHKEAKVAYEQAWERQKSTELAIKLSETLARVGQRDASIKPLIDWLSEHPDDIRVLLFLGAAYQNQGDDAKAKDAYENALAIDPENVVVLNNLAWLFAKGNDPRAVELAERAYNASPDNAGIQDTYGWVLVQQGQAEKGRRVLDRAMEKLPDVAEVRYHYAVALIKTGDKTEGEKILQKLLDSGKSFEGKEAARDLLGD